MKYLMILISSVLILNGKEYVYEPEYPTGNEFIIENKKENISDEEEIRTKENVPYNMKETEIVPYEEEY